MNRKIVSALALIAAVTASAPAHAGWLIEPYVGYNIGNLTEDDGADSFSMSGVGFGARAGMTFTALFVAADFQLAPITADIEGTDVDFQRTTLGITAGASLSSFRLWGGLNFINNLVRDENEDTFKGLGFKFGGGYEIVPMVLSLNLEYFISPISEFCEDGANCQDAADDSATANTFTVTVSAPFSI